MSMRVLVTGAGGDIGDAVGRILAETDDVVSIGTDASGEWPARAAFEEFRALPWATDPGYLTELRRIVAEESIDVVVPLTEPELAVLSGAPEGLPLLWAGAEITGIFLDKRSTAEWLAAQGLPGARTWRVSEIDAGYLPAVAKPRRGWGGRGVRILRRPEDLAAFQGQDDEVVIQELLDGDGAELTCGVVRLGGVVRTVQLQRTLAGGVTARATVVRDSGVERLLQALAEALDLEGAVNVQLRLTSAGPRVFEVNPRLSSTVMMRHRLGFQDLRWWLDFRHGLLPPDWEPPIGARVFRLSRELIVPC